MGVLFIKAQKSALAERDKTVATRSCSRPVVKKRLRIGLRQPPPRAFRALAGRAAADLMSPFTVTVLGKAAALQALHEAGQGRQRYVPCRHALVVAPRARRCAEEHRGRRGSRPQASWACRSRSLSSLSWARVLAPIKIRRRRR